METNDAPCTFGFATAERILSAASKVELMELTPKSGDLSGSFDGLSFLRITGAAVAGKYPAQEITYDADTGTWSDGVYDSIAFEINGAALTTGTKLKGRLAGWDLNAAGEVRPLFAVQASGGGGTSGSTFVVVKITSALPPLTGVQSTYNEISKTWSDGTTNLTLVEANGNNIPVGKRVLAMKSGNVYIIGLDPVAVTSVVCNSGTLTVVGRN